MVGLCCCLVRGAKCRAASVARGMIALAVALGI